MSVDNQCLICSTKFKNKFEVFQHVKLDHSDEIEVNMGSDLNLRSNKQTNIEQTFQDIKINKPTAGLYMGLPGSQNGLNPSSNKPTNFETNFQEDLIEPTPLIVEFYSCPASDKLSPCPNYNSEEKVRQHIAFFHKINFEAQMLCGLKIKKTIL